MTPTDIASPRPQRSIADVFLQHLGNGDIDQLGELFEPDVTLTALLPEGLHEWRGPDVTRAFRSWFGRVDEIQLLKSAVGHVGPRLYLRWRARVRGGPFGDASFVVEQQLYADAGPTGRIHAMSMLCSGFAALSR